MRLLGLALDATADFHRGSSEKNAGLFAALDRRHELLGVLRPELPWGLRRWRQALAFHPRRSDWRVRFNGHPATFLARTREAERQLMAWRGSFDLVVQLHTLHAPGLDPGAWPFALHTDNSYLLSERGWPEWAPLRGRLRRQRVELEGRVFRAARALFPRSEWLRRSLIEDYGCDPARTVRVGGGANLALEDLGPRRWDGRVALFVGQEFERKGGRILLAAWERVRRAVPGARLRVVCADRAPALPPGVEWLGPIRERGALVRELLGASVFALPSLFEPWGHAFLEAMGCGLPCVASTACAMPEIVREGATGRLVPPGEAGPLAEVLVALLRDPDEAERLGRAAHAEVLAQHRWDHVVARMDPWLEAAAAAP